MANIARRVIPAAPGVPALEPIKQDLYDTKQLDMAAPAGVLEFFKNPAAGELFSNMAASGQLPHPQQYHVYGLCVTLTPNADTTPDSAAGKAAAWLANKKKMREAGWLKFHIGAKDYLTLPLKRIPEGLGVVGFGAGATSADIYGVTTNGIQDISHYYDVTIKMAGKIKPIHIPSQQSFYVQIYWPTQPTYLAEQFEVDIRVYLVGILWREVQ